MAELYPQVASELQRIAARLMRDQPVGHTLQPTALVHEAYLKLVKSDRVQWTDRAHFLSARVSAPITQQLFEFACHARDTVARRPDRSRDAKPLGAGRVIRLIVCMWNHEHRTPGA